MRALHGGRPWRGELAGPLFDAGARALERAFDRAPVSYTHLRAHETVLDLVCRLLLEKKNNTKEAVTRAVSDELNCE